MVLLVPLLFFFYFYAAGYIVYLITRLVLKKKIHRGLTAAQVISITAFFYLQYLVQDQKLIFTGTYQDGREHWGAGMANVYTSLFNHAILVAIFIVLQFLILFLFSKKNKQLNASDLAKDFLNDPD